MILKGFIIGIGKIIPGVSGALLAMSLGIYEKCIYILSHLKEELFKNIKFILYLSIGFIISILIGSRIIYYFVNNYYIYTMYLFIGLIMGTIPSLISSETFNIKNLFFLLIGFILLFSINFVKLNINFNSYFLLGFIESISTLIPGISGTSIMILLGNYNMMLELLINPFKYQFIIFLFGLIIGIIIISKFINYFITKYRSQSYYLITGFLLSSIIMIYLNMFHIKISIIDALICILLFIIGILISNKIKKINN